MLLQRRIYSYISILNQPVSRTCTLSRTQAREQHMLTVNINMSEDEKVPVWETFFTLSNKLQSAKGWGGIAEMENTCEPALKTNVVVVLLADFIY